MFESDIIPVSSHIYHVPFKFISFPPPLFKCTLHRCLLWLWYLVKKIYQNVLVKTKFLWIDQTNPSSQPFFY